MKIESFTGAYIFLSNFYPCAVVMDDRIYPSVEHAYQAAKCADRTQRERFVHLSTAGKAKYWGRRVAMRPDWEIVKGLIMSNLLLSKFGEQTLRAKLLATDDVELIEGNYWHDTYWGVCDGVGENHLGKMLMWVRAVYRAEDALLPYLLPIPVVVHHGMGAPMLFGEEKKS